MQRGAAGLGHNGGPPLSAGDIARELRYALDPATFARERLGFEPDPWQERVLRSGARQTLLNCSRQSGKSTTTAALAAHTALYRPGSLTLMVSKAQRQSGELFAKVAGFLKSLDQPPKLDSDNALSSRLANGSRIVGSWPLSMIRLRAGTSGRAGRGWPGHTSGA